MRNVVSILLAGAALAVATPALAQTEIDGWSLNDDGQSCAISKLGADNRSLTMLNDGKPTADGLGFISLDLADRGIAKGQAITLGVSINNGPFVDKPAIGMVLSGGESGFMMYSLPLSTFGGANPAGTVRFRWNGEVIHTITLDGLARPFAALTECGKKY